MPAMFMQTWALFFGGLILLGILIFLVRMGAEGIEGLREDITDFDHFSLVFISIAGSSFIIGFCYSIFLEINLPR